MLGIFSVFVADQVAACAREKAVPSLDWQQTAQISSVRRPENRCQQASDGESFRGLEVFLC